MYSLMARKKVHLEGNFVTYCMVVERDVELTGASELEAEC